MIRNEPVTEVSVDTTFDEEAITPTEAYGGIRIRLDGTRLNRYVDEQRHEWSEWNPEYVGEYLTSDLWKLIETTTAVRQDPEVYGERTVEFTELVSRLVMERLDEGTLRIAFRTSEESDPAAKRVMAPPRCACGVPVEESAWGNAVLRAGRAVRDDLVELGHTDLGDGFDPILEDLQRSLADE